MTAREVIAAELTGQHYVANLNIRKSDVAEVAHGIERALVDAGYRIIPDQISDEMIGAAAEAMDECRTAVFQGRTIAEICLRAGLGCGRK